MKRFILIGVFCLVGMFISNAHAGFKFDFEPMEVESYSLNTAFSLTGESKILVGGTIDPLFIYESVSFPTISFFSFGILSSKDIEGASVLDFNAGIDLLKFKKFRFGIFKSLDDFTFGRDLFKGWNFMGGLEWKFPVEVL